MERRTKLILLGAGAVGVYFLVSRATGAAEGKQPELAPLERRNPWQTRIHFVYPSVSVSPSYTRLLDRAGREAEGRIAENPGAEWVLIRSYHPYTVTEGAAAEARAREYAAAQGFNLVDEFRKRGVAAVEMTPIPVPLANGLAAEQWDQWRVATLRFRGERDDLIELVYPG